jgi:hypothetical protein
MSAENNVITKTAERVAINQRLGTPMLSQSALSMRGILVRISDQLGITLFLHDELPAIKS